MKIIDVISTLFFATNELSLNNLLEVHKNSQNIFITGNTIVDSLQLSLNNTTPSKRINNLIERIKSS